MKFLPATILIFLICFVGSVTADHIEYCKVEVREIFLEQNVSSGTKGTFCSNGEIKVKAAVSMTGLIQTPAEVKLYSDGLLIETQTANPSGNYYLISFSNSIPTYRPKDPQVNVTISAGCDPSPDNMVVNYTVTDCQPSTTYYTTKYERIPGCMPTYLENYRCFGNWLQRLKQNPDCNQTWQDWEYCSYSCSNITCLQKPTEEELQKMEEEQESSTEYQQQYSVISIETSGVYLLAALGATVLIFLLIYRKIFNEHKVRLTPESF